MRTPSCSECYNRTALQDNGRKTIARKTVIKDDSVSNDDEVAMSGVAPIWHYNFYEAARQNFLLIGQKFLLIGRKFPFTGQNIILTAQNFLVTGQYYTFYKSDQACTPVNTPPQQHAVMGSIIRPHAYCPLSICVMFQMRLNIPGSWKQIYKTKFLNMGSADQHDNAAKTEQKLRKCLLDLP